MWTREDDDLNTMYLLLEREAEEEDNDPDYQQYIAMRRARRKF